MRRISVIGVGLTGSEAARQAAQPCNYITQTNIQDFRPMKANFGVLSEPSVRFLTKREKARFLTERSLRDHKSFHSIFQG